MKLDINLALVTKQLIDTLTPDQQVLLIEILDQLNDMVQKVDSIPRDAALDALETEVFRMLSTALANQKIIQKGIYVTWIFL